ncbi:MAG: pilus assembly protein PilM [Planctomycetota bacterium]|jgi:type IV pilus assembly protein PilM
MLRSRTALGIDISDGRINLALVRKNGDGVKLLRAASGPVPDGAIKDGNVEDATVLAKAIKKLKTKNRIHSHRTVFSLVANPTLMQILDLPKDARGNVRQFVQDEVKHYAVLPINKAAVDFCGIKSSPKSSNHRVLVVASDSQKITAAARAFNREGLNIDAIEPAWVAYIRACYAKKIAKKFDTSLLFAIVCDRTLTLSVFRNQTLDFVRTERIEPATLQSEEYFEWLAEEINAVIKFYELEVHDEHNKWHVTLVANISGESVSEATESLRARLDPVELEVRTLEHARLTIAVGLAMKLLDVPDGGLNIDLLPPELMEAKSAEKQTLVIANIAAAIIFLIILSIGFLSSKVEKVSADIKRKKQTQVGRNTPALLNEQALLQGQITDVSEKLDLMNNALSTGSVLGWDQILTDIRLATPKTVLITELISSDNSKMLLDGQALSYEAIYLFVDALNTCKSIESASLIGTEKHSGSDSMVRYSISCSLTQ